MSFTFSMVCRTSGSVSFISSLVVSRSSSTAPSIPRNRSKTTARASATMSAATPKAIHMKLWLLND
ncbi:MAG: hypothetical protein AUI15_11830 [Actinobacteria bacterium 13_2_20CM_2_66_6]|nr:MAG: hypothetical protein AUI15_11830 [Actinobacteria bacterium 13_2_20CM_2_66_6]